MTNPEQFGEDGPGRDLAGEGFDTTLGDESTGGQAGEQAVGQRADDERSGPGAG